MYAMHPNKFDTVEKPRNGQGKRGYNMEKSNVL